MLHWHAVQVLPAPERHPRRLLQLLLFKGAHDDRVDFVVILDTFNIKVCELARTNFFQYASQAGQLTQKRSSFSPSFSFCLEIYTFGRGCLRQSIFVITKGKS